MRFIYLSLVFLMLFASCSRGNKSAGLFIYNQDDPYVHLFTEQILHEAEDLIAIDVFDAQNSQIIQNEFIEKKIKSSTDVMIINPVDRLGAYSIIKKLKSKNIPVIFFNREPLVEDLDLWDEAYYVGAKAEQSGEIQAEMIMELFGNNPKKLNKHDKNGNGIIETVILKGEQGHQDAEIRTSQVVETFTENGFKLDILITEIANWNRDEAYEKMKVILEKYNSSIELIISNNDAMALGAISLMRQSGYFQDTNNNQKIDNDDKKWIPIVGIDGLDEAVEMIKSGYLYGSVLNDSLDQAKAIVELTDFIVHKKDFNQMKFPLIDGKYIWIDYKVLQ
ncbi:MAG: galactose ABC transporter substrate-binding protein [Spirochaetaceae bacterium]|jgi:methyl-galactoside transport system substrate-binding protein|nr:galactose ABC transporter substrate-binding protein [Spirochaetaceae bacterium]